MIANESMSAGAGGASEFIEPSSDADPRNAAAGQLTESVDSILAWTLESDSGAGPFIGRELSVRDALAMLIGSLKGLTVDQASRKLNRLVAAIDAAVNDQLNEILHHPRFQALESAWRGLRFLADRVFYARRRDVRLRVLQITWAEIERDLERATEFDQSQLFNKIYEQEFGTAGGIPYAAIIGNFEIRPKLSASHPHDDVATLAKISGVAAAAFCPMVFSASPAMFGADQFSDLQYQSRLSARFSERDMLEWNSFRESEDARFIALCLPRILMRLPYQPLGRDDGFCFREDVEARDTSKYLWGNAAFAFGEVLIRAYMQVGWYANIRGFNRDVEGGGLITGLPVHSFGTDPAGVTLKSSVNFLIDEQQEAELSQLGFLALCNCRDTPYSVFFSCSSVQRPRTYNDPSVTENARISAMLHYILCASRFAHYVKIIGRDTVGGLTDASELQDQLQRWLREYVTPDEKAKPEIKARRPLRQADVEIRAEPSKPGTYHCLLKLWPHYQLDELQAAIHMTASIEDPSQP